MKTITKSTIFSFLLVLFHILFIGCAIDDEGLVDEQYPGEPIVELKGALKLDIPENFPDQISFALFWDTVDEDDPLFDPAGPFDGDELWEVEVCDGKMGQAQFDTVRAETTGWVTQSATYDTAGLVRFNLPIYELPPLAARKDLATECGGGDGWYSVGYFIAYADENDVPLDWECGDEFKL